MTLDRAPATEASAPTEGHAATEALVPAVELDALRARFEGELPQFLADLKRLCSVDCGSYTPAGVNQVADWVEAFFTGIGARVERRQDPTGRYGDTVIATIDGRPGGPRVLLIGHMDTVFDEGTCVRRPFRIRDGIAYGPGVTDMKGGLLTGLYALQAVVGASAAGGPGLAFERLVFIANPDEEIGSPSSTPHIRDVAATSDACLVLECARANGDFVSSRKGIFDLRVTIHGRAAHAGVEPERGRNAIAAGANLVTALQALNARWPGVTANVGVFKSGTRPNIVPDLAELEVDVRGTTRDSLEAALGAVRSIAAAPGIPDVTTEVETMATWMPMEKLERSGHLVAGAIDLAARLGFATSDAATGGASDANTTSGMGVPTIDGLGPIGGRDHSPDEYLEVASIVPRTALVAALLLAIGRDPVVAGWRSAGRDGGAAARA
ncbi:MAG TPA: M20 family metallopeptidase [Candidatus Limnocylindrales bacterium]|nr:M20 family metallopeptidase [Candidatus Limnocylindrales bacterium]